MKITRSQLRRMIAECMFDGMDMASSDMDFMEEPEAMDMGGVHEPSGRELGTGGDASMARGQLFTMAQKAQSLYDRLTDDDTLPEWVQYKITMAHDYIRTAEEYLGYKMSRYDMGDPLPAYESLRRGLEYTRLHEDDAATPKPGSEEANVKGTLDTKKIASTLGVDPVAFQKAVAAAKAGSRSATNNATLADVFVELMEAQPTDTVTVMNVLKKVKGTDGESK